MTWKGKTFIPLAVVGVGILGAAAMIAARPDVPTRSQQAQAPLIRVVVAQPREVQLTVRAQGTVTPRTETDLIPEVSGRVIWVSPSLAAGGFFEADDVLVRLDGRDYEIAVERATAARARRESESRLARANLMRSRSLSERGVVSASALDDAENAARVATAAVREAQAALGQANLDLERTEIRAPFAGRVREEHVDVGQFVTRGTAIASLYAVDYAEIRLPIPDDQIAFLDLPLGYRGDAQGPPGPEVVLNVRFAGRQNVWRGVVVRTEGAIDPRSRMMHVVAQIENPYGRGTDPDRPPLAVGLFVEAQILGQRIEHAVVLPRVAMRGTDQVLVVDADDRLRFRRVDVLRAEGESVVLRGGLTAGERICVSSLETVVDGMKVRVVEEQAPVAGVSGSETG